MSISPLTPDGWILDLFSSEAARTGSGIRRHRRNIERHAGMDRFVSEIVRRGYVAVENADQIVIFCNRQPIRRLVPFSLKENGPETFKVSGYTDAR